MKKLIFVLGILAVIVLAGCDKVTEYPEVPITPEPAPSEPEVVEEPVVEEPEVEEKKESSEVVELKITIDYSITDEDEEEANLDRISVHVKNTKYTARLDYPKHDLRLKVYATKDGEETRVLWMDNVIEEEDIRYGMIVTNTESRRGYKFTDNVVIDVEIYDYEDILLATASKTVTR